MKVILFTINFMILQQHVKQLIRNEFTIIYNFNKIHDKNIQVLYLLRKQMYCFVKLL